MLYAKFQDHRTLGSDEEDCKKSKQYMVVSAILFM